MNFINLHDNYILTASEEVFIWQVSDVLLF